VRPQGLAFRRGQGNLQHYAELDRAHIGEGRGDGGEQRLKERELP